MIDVKWQQLRDTELFYILPKMDLTWKRDCGGWGGACGDENSQLDVEPEDGPNGVWVDEACDKDCDMWRHGKCLFMCNMALIAELTRAQKFEQFLRMEKMPTTLNST